MLHQGKGRRLEASLNQIFDAVKIYNNHKTDNFSKIYNRLRKEDRGDVSFFPLAATLKHSLLFFPNRMGNKRIFILLLN